MEENPGTDAGLPDGICINCKTRPATENAPNKLCPECREGFIKHPIPKWLFGFLAGIAVLMLISLYNMPGFVKTAIYMHRAQKALEGHYYKTALNESDKVLARYPRNIQANAIRMVASSYNLDVLRLTQASAALEGISIEDKGLYQDMTDAMARVNQYFPNDTIVYQRVSNFKADSAAVLKSFMNVISMKNELELCSKYILADKFYDIKAYHISDSLLQVILGVNREHIPALHLLAALKRNEEKYDEALGICDRLLAINHQDASALSQKARIEIKRHDDAMAGKYLAEAAEVDSTDLSVLETKAILQHLSGKSAESRQTLDKIKAADTEDGEIYKRTYKVLYNIEKYR